MRYLTISIVILLFFLKQGFAQNREIDSLNREKLNEIVVTAQYIPQSIKKSVYKIRTINSEEIKSLGATSLRDLLYYELNLEVFQQGSFSGTGIEIQGISQENIKILVDGIPVVGRLRGTIDLNHIILNNIERVEIIEGPTSVYYGTDAMGGVINLITKDSSNDQFISSIQSYIESLNTFNITGNISASKKNNSFNIDLGRNYFDGFTADDKSRKSDWGSREQYFGNFSFKHLVKKGSLIFNSKYFTEELSNLGEMKPEQTALDFVSNTKRIENNLQYKQQLSDYNYITGIIALSNYKRTKETFLTDLIDNSQELITEQSDTTFNNTLFFKGQFSHVNNQKKINYSLGFETNIEEIKGARIKDKKQKLNTHGIFASLNYNFLEHFSFQPGLRYTYNTTFGSVISPAIHFKYQINKKNKLLFSYANGFRSPSINQLFLNFRAGPFLIIGNEDLEAEKSNNYTISSYHEIKLFNNNLIIEPSFFYNDIDNLIALGPAQDFKRQYINIDSNNTKGGKIQFSYNSLSGLYLSAGFSSLSKYNSFTEKFDIDDFIVTNKINATAKYTFQNIATTLNVHFKHNGKELGYYVDKKSGDLVTTELDAYNLLDFTAFRSFFKNKLEMTIGIKNILNETNLDNLIQSTGTTKNQNAFLYGTSYFAKVIFKI